MPPTTRRQQKSSSGEGRAPPAPQPRKRKRDADSDEDDESDSEPEEPEQDDHSSDSDASEPEDGSSSSGESEPDDAEDLDKTALEDQQELLNYRGRAAGSLRPVNCSGFTSVAEFIYAILGLKYSGDLDLTVGDDIYTITDDGDRFGVGELECASRAEMVAEMERLIRSDPRFRLSTWVIQDDDDDDQLFERALRHCQNQLRTFLNYPSIPEYDDEGTIDAIERDPEDDGIPEPIQVMNVLPNLQQCPVCFCGNTNENPFVALIHQNEHGSGDSSRVHALCSRCYAGLSNAARDTRDAVAFQCPTCRREIVTAIQIPPSLFGGGGGGM